MKQVFNFLLLNLGFVTLSSAQINSRDEQAINKIFQTMEQGWNTKSGKLFASSFAPDHDYIVWTGMYFGNLTVEQNGLQHQGIFDSFHRTTDLKLKLDKLRVIREDLILAHVLGATFEKGTPVPENPQVIITMLLEKQQGEWKIISFHNCDIELSFEANAPQQGPVPPRVMYKSWYNKV